MGGLLDARACWSLVRRRLCYWYQRRVHGGTARCPSLLVPRAAAAVLLVSTQSTWGDCSMPEPAGPSCGGGCVTGINAEYMGGLLDARACWSLVRRRLCCWYHHWRPPRRRCAPRRWVLPVQAQPAGFAFQGRRCRLVHHVLIGNIGMEIDK